MAHFTGKTVASFDQGAGAAHAASAACPKYKPECSFIAGGGATVGFGECKTLAVVFDPDRKSKALR